MRMANCAARVGTIVLEEEHRVIFSACTHLCPVLHAECDQSMHMVARIARDVGVAVPSLDEDELIRLLNDIVFIFEQDDVAVRRDDVRELVRCAERTRRTAVDDVLGLLSADVRIEMGKVDVHKYSPSYNLSRPIIYLLRAFVKYFIERSL